MQKTILVLALVFACALADNNITWNNNNTKNASLWATEPKLVVASNDTNFTNKGLRLAYTTNNIMLRGRNVADKTDTVRNISIKELSYTNTTDNVSVIYNVDLTAEISYVADSVYLYSNTQNDDQGISQVKLVKFFTNYNNTGTEILITKNAANTDKPLKAEQIFAHKGRYFIVYSSANGTVWVASVAKDDNKPVITVITNTSDPNPAAKCVGITAKDTLYCNWLAIREAGKTDFFLAEALVEPLKNITSAVTDFFNGTQNNIRPDAFNTYNAGKQYGGLVKIGAAYKLRNYATNKTVDIVAPTAPTGYGQATLVDFYAYLDDIALFWEYPNTDATLNTLKSSGVQFVNSDGDASNNSTLYQAFTSSDYVQYIDGSLFILARNQTTAYLGKLWGDTKMSGSLLQTAFVALVALFAGIILA